MKKSLLIFPLCVGTLLFFLAGCDARDRSAQNIRGTLAISLLNQIKTIEMSSFLSERQSDWKIILDSKDEYRYPAWSPDGKYIAMGYMSSSERSTALQPQDTHYHLAMFKADGSERVNLLSDKLNYEFPAWSPDSKTIAYVSYPNWPQERIGRVCILDLKSKKQRCIDKVEAEIFKPSWSADGLYLVFTNRDSAIAVYDKVKDSVRILPFKGRSPIFNPDGQHIYFVQNDNQAISSVEIDGTRERIIRKGFVDYLINISTDGHYLLCIGGGSHSFIIPGPEYSTLEVLDLTTQKTISKSKFSNIYGASWLE